MIISLYTIIQFACVTKLVLEIWAYLQVIKIHHYLNPVGHLTFAPVVANQLCHFQMLIESTGFTDTC